MLKLFCCATTVFVSLVRPCLGLVLVSLPEIQLASGTVMADLMLGCFVFAAALFYGRYLDRDRWRDALAFGLLSALALLVR